MDNVKEDLWMHNMDIWFDNRQNNMEESYRNLSWVYLMEEKERRGWRTI